MDQENQFQNNPQQNPQPEGSPNENTANQPCRQDGGYIQNSYPQYPPNGYGQNGYPSYPPNGYGQNGYQSYPQNGYQQMPDGPNYQPGAGGSNGLAIAAMICGILSVACCCVFYFSGILAVAAIIMGIISLAKNMEGKGMAIAGIVTGSVGFLLMLYALFQMLTETGFFA